MAAPYGSPAEQARTVAALADLAAQPAAATWQELSEP
jgi:hypothetical protein